MNFRDLTLTSALIRRMEPILARAGVRIKVGKARK